MRRTFVGLVACHLAACGGSTVGENTAGDGKGAGAGGGAAVGAGVGGSGSVSEAGIGGNAPAGADGAGARTGTTCADQTAAGEMIVSAAFGVAEANLSCNTDADCELVSGGSNCTNSCQSTITSSVGAKAVQAAIDRVNTGVCASFVSDGCVLTEPPCGGPPTGAACVSGACKAFPPQDWLSLAIDEAHGPASTFSSTPPSCTTGQDCTVWKLTPDGAIQKTESGVVSSAKLSSADFQTVDGILRSVSFRQIVAGPPPPCDQAPSGARVSLDLENRYEFVGLNVTGCALAGPTGNDVMLLYDVIRAY